MYELIQTPRETPVITPEQLAAFGRWDCPQMYVGASSPQVYTDDYELLLTFIEAATDEVETMAAQACLNEQILLTFDAFPGQDYHRHIARPDFWWWHGHTYKDSIELVRRPVLVPSGSPVTNNLSVLYTDPTGTQQTLDASTYTVFADKITLNVGQHWPATDRREDCVQVTYWAGYSAEDPTQVPSRLRMAILFLANHFYQVRQVVSVEATSEVGFTLCRMLSSFRSMRVPR